MSLSGDQALLFLGGGGGFNPFGKVGQSNIGSIVLTDIYMCFSYQRKTNPPFTSIGFFILVL